MALRHSGSHKKGRVHSRASSPWNSAYTTQGAIPGYENSSICYLNARDLSLHFGFSQAMRVFLIFALVVAAIIGAFMVYLFIDNVINYQEREQEQIQENISREIPLALPDVVSLMWMGDGDIMATVEQTGAPIYVRTYPSDLPAGGLEVVKLPDDITVEEAEAMYSTGLDNIGAVEATRVLNGSWDLRVTRNDGCDIYIWYADFTSTTLESAVQNAIDGVGLGGQVIADSGIDSVGNTYASGTIDNGEDVAPFTWRVSTVPLSDMYSISGLPDKSYYVGIRVTT